MNPKEIENSIEATNDLFTLLKDKRNFNWNLFKEYVNTYDIKHDSANDNCTFEDMLYGLAIAIDNKYEWADGYKLFKKQLKEWLK